MAHARLHAVLLGAAVLVSAAGCQQDALGPLADLPTHRLDPAAGAAARQRPDARRPDARQAALTAEQKAWYVPPSREWRYIVIHHSATDGGNAQVFDAAHRGRGWDEMGYHFLITNGDGGPDGHVEVGSRWRKQKWGAHCGGTPDNEYNNHGIGVCLVGDFTRHLPSGAQIGALERLTLFLMRTYGVAPENVLGHRDCPSAATACPGNAFDRYLRTSFLPKITHNVALAK